MKQIFGVVLCLFCLIACRAEPTSDAAKAGSSQIQESASIAQEHSVTTSAQEVVSDVIAEEEISQGNAESNPDQNTKKVVTPIVKGEVEKPIIGDKVAQHVEYADTKPTPIIEIRETEKEVGLNQPAKTEEIAEEEKQEVENTAFKETTSEKEIVAADMHEDWDKLLKRYVTPQGGVDYAGFKSSKTELESYLSELDKNSPQKDWSKAKTMAYWINAYNAHTVHLIVSNYPLNSITDLDGGDPWKVKRISIGGKMYSLNNIEHDILRPQYKDPRIHFAVNCAAKSCPKIHNGAWTQDNLEVNLNKLTKEFVNNKEANKISKNEVTLSKIFDWYKSDFVDLISFLNKYSEVKIDNAASVKYRDYNWQLNSK